MPVSAEDINGLVQSAWSGALELDKCIDPSERPIGWTERR